MVGWIGGWVDGWVGGLVYVGMYECKHAFIHTYCCRPRRRVLTLSVVVMGKSV